MTKGFLARLSKIVTVMTAVARALERQLRQTFFVLAAGFLLLLPGTVVAGENRDSHFRSRVAQEACQLEKDASPARDAGDPCVLLSALVSRVRKVLPEGVSPEQTIEALNHSFFEVERLEPTYDLSREEFLLPGHVLAGKKGHCVGLASVYLVVAEELNLPIHAVATPKHVFLRWDDGKVHRNIELFQKGREVTDEDYVRDERIPQESIEQGVFLANLSSKEFLGFIYQNRGVLESQRGDFRVSRHDYARAIRLNPKLAAAYYNRGNDELKQEKYRKAIRDYTEALKLYPTDVWALHNRGLAWKGRGRLEDAERDWKRVQEIEPGFKVPE